ncbi:ROK family protein [Streptomyces sp. CRN 30]|uniref:ROK family protein n=1 Tax=Streptomyces sp. CRN 30 TaxID=3075613 RepID=UPI002A8038CF|nr:ROK family protein [Streptomyces sp. CRN 30]
METIGIREVSGDLIKAAADRGDVLGITNGRVLAGVLMPLKQTTVERLVDQNLTRILQNTREGQRDAAAGGSAALDDLAAEEPRPAGRRAPARVTIRGLSGTRIEEAAAAREALVVTHGGEAVALLVPVTLQWVEQLVERNLSRIRHSIERGEHEIAAGGQVPTLDELLQEGEAEEARSPDGWPKGARPPEGRPEQEGPAEEGPDRGRPHERSSSAWPGPPGAARGGLLHQRAIGITIVSDGMDSSSRLIGVVTDMLGRITSGPVVTPLSDLDQGHVLACILDLIDELREELHPGLEQLVGVGMGIGGHVHRGTIVNSPHAGWRRFPLAALVQQRVDVPVVLENDANALAVRERFIGGIDDESMAVVLITDGGVGASLVLNGRVFRGARGMAGELGHIPVEADGDTAKVKCRCGSHGCLESVTAPAAMARTLAGDGFHGGFDAAVEDGDATAPGGAVRTVLDRAGEALGRGVATLVNLFNPSTVVLVGPPSLVGAPRSFRNGADTTPRGTAGLYMSAMERTVNDHAFSTGADDCQFVVRQVDDAESAAAAAACIIEQFAPPGRNVRAEQAHLTSGRLSTCLSLPGSPPSPAHPTRPAAHRR